MTSIDRPDPVILGHVLAEHRELFCQMSAVRTAFAARHDGASARNAADAIAAALRSLREHLRCHFEQEETGGFMEESIARMPRLSGAVKAILRQHPALLAELDALIEGISGRPLTPDDWNQAGRAFEQFAANVAAHERDENRVVQEGYNEDLGLLD
jgi:hypothetical protein